MTDTEKDARRYQTVRRLNVPQFKELFRKSQVWDVQLDVQFDALVDRIGDGRIRFTDASELVRVEK
jgi:hypothetical protein